jgi:preprotein translocase subunit SecD
MYQFARWKYWLVIIVVVSGTLLALPNVFGEGPALQLSRNDRTAMDQAAQQRVLGVLETQKITPEVSYLQKDRLVLRFADDRQQTSAREAILKGTSGDYLVALSSVPRMPEWMRHVPFFKPMSLGLDLRGGVHRPSSGWSATCARACATSEFRTARSVRRMGSSKSFCATPRICRPRWMR